jgi:hypothetical protein
MAKRNIAAPQQDMEDLLNEVFRVVFSRYNNSKGNSQCKSS